MTIVIILFFDLIENLGLITMKESDKSSISKEEAEEFYRVNIKLDIFNEYDDVDADALVSIDCSYVI